MAAKAEYAYKHNVTLTVGAGLLLGGQYFDDATHHLQNRDLEGAKDDLLKMKGAYSAADSILTSGYYPPPSCCSAFYSQAHRLLIDEVSMAQYLWGCTYDKQHGYDSGDCDTAKRLAGPLGDSQTAWVNAAQPWL
ncbi:MAG: hypothetical protein ABR586_11110 [Thermoplasmatota archaeon]